MVAFSTTQPLYSDTDALKAVWTTIDSASCPYHYNFHLHTRCSDGKLDPEALIQQAIDVGLKGLAITDHHSIDGFQRARRWLESNLEASFHPRLWTGIEITALLLGTEVHILGYGFDPTYSALGPYLQGSRTEGDLALASTAIERLHRAGGLTVLAHPFRYHRDAGELIPAAVDAGIDGIEAFYAYGNPKPWRASQPETDRALELNRLYGLFTTCGTDSHGTSLLQRI
jgi:predicted metal-dependent phosphoesterase TrpH